MSHIPNSAMPHAIDTAERDGEERSGGWNLSERAGKVADLARANPAIAIAAGAAVVAGAAAAAAVPLMRGWSSGAASRSSGKSSKNS